MVTAKSIDPGAERWTGSGDCRFECCDGGRLLGARGCANNIGGACEAPNVKVGSRVADIVKALESEMLRKKRGFRCSFKISSPVAGMDFVEEAEVIGDRFGKTLIGSCYKRDSTTGCLFLLEQVKNFLPV